MLQHVDYGTSFPYFVRDRAIRIVGRLTCVVLRLGILDEPNMLKHSGQPSTGGIAIFVAFVCGFATVWFVSDEARLSTFHLAGFAVAATGIASVGFWMI